MEAQCSKEKPHDRQALKSQLLPTEGEWGREQKKQCHLR